MTQLRRLDIDNNALQDDGLSAFPPLPERRVLDVSENADLRGKTLHALAT